MNDNDEEDIYKVEDDEEYVEKVDKTEELKAKLIRYAIIAFVGLIILILLIAIFSPKSSSNKDAIIKEVTLNAGEKYETNHSKGSYTWTSSNQKVAKVSDDGEIIAVKNGDATVTIKSSNETATYKVHVDAIEESLIVTSVKMEKNTIELEKDKTYNMTVSFFPNSVTNVQLTWSSSDEKIAIVQDGVIKAKEVGTAVITVMTPNGNMDYCLVKVLGDGNYNPVESISIESTDVSMNKGTSYNLVYEVVPSKSVNLITWESSDEKIATVENGIVYALSGGEVTVTAKSGDISKTVNVKVIAEVEVEESKVVLDYNTLGLSVGEGFALKVKDDLPITWSSSNPSVVVVDQTGGLIAIAEGESVITATTEDEYYDECVITVSNSSENDKIKLNSNSLSLSVGTTGRLTATVTPSNNVSIVTWKSSDTSIATVKSGEVKAIKEGTTTITAKLPNGQTAECIVNVSKNVVNVAQVQINVNSVTLKKDKSTQLTAKVLPTTATNKAITWSSSDTSIATVDKNGKVTAKKKGSAKIYAKASNGVFDVCSVYVQ